MNLPHTESAYVRGADGTGDLTARAVIGTPAASLNELEERVLVFTPAGREAPFTSDVLRRSGIKVKSCENEQEFCSELERGAAAAIVAEEALGVNCVRMLVQFLDAQPAWSDLPLIVFSRHGSDIDPILERLGPLANAAVVERPTRLRPLLSSVRVALRSRHRQYEVRDLLTKIAETDRRKDEFLAMLGHELRNPLAAIRTASALLANVDDQRVTRPLQVVTRQTVNLTRIVEDLLDVSRVLSGKITLRRRFVELNQAAEQAARGIDAAVQDRAQTMSLALLAEPVFVHADPVRIEQVLSNLLHNAVKYTPPHGHIKLGVSRRAGHARVSVSDDGIGVEKTMLSTIFEPFMQVGASLDRSQGGLGLGLPLVKKIMELHAGNVHVESAGVGLGTRFTIELPESVDIPKQGSPPIAEVQSPSAATGAAARVLIVDDNLDLLEMLRDLLFALGHHADIASDGHHAIQRALTDPPDVALVDIGLPGLDGYQIAQRIRASLGPDRVRLVAMTGYGQPEDRRRALEAGFDDHLVKPVEPSDLLKVLSARRAS